VYAFVIRECKITTEIMQQDTDLTLDLVFSF